MATVLVVDDDATNREYLRTLLIHRGHRVCEAADGDSALRIAGREPLDAVITDVLMPGLDGYELARQLRSRSATSRVPIAFNTAHYGRQEIQPLARACGVQEVILKPAPPAAVLTAIDALLSAGSESCVGTAATPEFAQRHRHALKTKLLETTTALRVAGDREAGLRLNASLLQERLAETQRVTQTGSWDLDPRSGVIVLSAGLRDRFRLPSSKVPQRRLWRRVHPDDVDRMTAAARETLRTGRPSTVELRVADFDGVVHEIVVSCRVAADGALWGVTQDVSEARAEQIRLRMLTDRQTERRVLERLHRAEFATEAPATTGADLAAVCLTAPDRLDIGGDWHDVLPVAGGRVLVSVGSVAGHDQDAVAVMGAVRAVLRAYAIEDPDPARVLGRLNRFLIADHGDGTYATAVAALYDPAQRCLHVANAGHQAPLLLTSMVVALGQTGPALGIFADASIDQLQLRMDPGAALLAYTDGLTDRHGDPAPEGERRLMGVAAEAHRRATSARQLVDEVLAAMLEDRAPDDDVCLTVLRTPG